MTIFVVTEHGYFRSVEPSLDAAVAWAKGQANLPDSAGVPKKIDTSRWDRAPAAAWSLVLDIIPTQDDQQLDFWSFVIEEYKVK